jgi:hypothetical protein
MLKLVGVVVALVATETGARSLALTVSSAAVDAESRLDAAFTDMASARPDGVLVMLDALTRWHRREIAAASSATAPISAPSPAVPRAT